MKAQVEQLLKNVAILLKHKKEKEILLGESFNVFSVLGVEYYENNTHSAFIAELLNPEGSHKKGNVFLKLFLNEIHYAGDLNPDTASVKKEFVIGKINPEEKSGGRIDILIEDGRNIISIENKINAGDRECQIERYCNYLPEQNTVYYLTKHGTEPEVFSKGVLEDGEHFFTISYKEHILNWMSECFKECSGNPILRETIRQYIVLIKRITNTMENKEQEELIKMMLENFEAASYISKNFDKTHRLIGEEIRKRVIEKLKDKIGEEYTVIPGSNAINSKYSQIWIYSKNFENSLVYYGVESFSGEGNHGGKIFIGVRNLKQDPKSPIENLRYKKKWNEEKFPEVFNGQVVNFNNYNLIASLVDDDEQKEKLVNHIVEFVLDYLKRTKTEFEQEMIKLHS